MLNLVRLRVIDTISLVPTDSDFVTIPAGAGTETTDNIIISVLHSVTYDGQDLLMSTRDILERTVRLFSAEA